MKDKLFKCKLRNTSLEMVKLPTRVWKDILKWELNDELVFKVEEVHNEEGILSQRLILQREFEFSDEDRVELCCVTHLCVDEEE